MARRTLASAPRSKKTTGAATDIVVEVVNRQRKQDFDLRRLQAAIRAVLMGEGVPRGNVSVAVVNDAEIQGINREFLQHDEPTDVISFALEQGAGFVDGEIIASAETALSAAGCFGGTADDELLLYVVHGALHLAGYDDQTAVARTAMRRREQHYLRQFGVYPRYQRSTQATGVVGPRKKSRRHATARREHMR